MAFGDVCAANMMYLLYRSFYLNASWGQNTAYKMVSPFLDPVIRAKIVITSDKTHPGIFELFHPSQIEKRFGGTAETPTNFWPPQVGNIFKPEK